MSDRIPGHDGNGHHCKDRAGHGLWHAACDNRLGQQGNRNRRPDAWLGHAGRSGGWTDGGTGIRPGGFLVLEECVIPTIGRMADVIAEDPMWTLVEVVGSTTAVFMRTDVETFDPEGDGCWKQPFNRKRVSSKRSIWMKDDAGTIDVISSLGLDRIVRGDRKRTAGWLRRQWRK